MNGEKKDIEEWAEDWAGDAESSAMRARQYAELAKRHVATAAALNRQSRLLNRVALLVLAGLVLLHLTNLTYALVQWWMTR